jgi:hypothetical protein
VSAYRLPKSPSSPTGRAGSDRCSASTCHGRDDSLSGGSPRRVTNLSDPKEISSRTPCEEGELTLHPNREVAREPRVLRTAITNFAQAPPSKASYPSHVPQYTRWALAQGPIGNDTSDPEVECKEFIRCHFISHSTTILHYFSLSQLAFSHERPSA